MNILTITACDPQKVRIIANMIDINDSFFMHIISLNYIDCAIYRYLAGTYGDNISKPSVHDDKINTIIT